MKNGVVNFLAIMFSIACLLLYPSYLLLQQIVPEVVSQDIEIIEFAVDYNNNKCKLDDVPSGYKARSNGSNLIIIGNGEVISFSDGNLVTWEGEDERMSTRSVTVVSLAAIFAIFTSACISIPLSKKISL